MIGDSVSLRTVDTFNNTFTHGHIDAAKNRQFAAGKGIFSDYAQQNLAGRIVVFALGTNGPVTDDAIDSLMEVVGPDRICVFITTRSPRQWVQSTNDALKRAAERYENVRVIDWYAYSEGRNDLFDGDEEVREIISSAEKVRLEAGSTVASGVKVTPRSGSICADSAA